MAKSKRSSPTKSPAENASSSVQLLYPVLAGCSLERLSLPDDVDEEKIERFYDSTIRRTNPQRGLEIAVCEFSAGQKYAEKNVLEIRATYYIALRMESGSSNEQKKLTMVELVEAAAWPLFRSLFIHIGSQSGEELPLLPNLPKLRWVAEK